MLQEVQPEEDVPAKGFDTPLIPKTESFFFTSPEPHLGQSTFVVLKTSFSNSCSHLRHTYS